MHKLLLSLFAVPTLASSMGMTAFMISAAAVPVETLQASCAPVSAKAHSAMRSMNSKNLSDAIELEAETPNTDFTAAESDAAVTLFGCDCPSCIGALRQLRTQISLNGGEGHCWSAVQGNSPQAVQAVLQRLEAQEAN